MGKSSGNPVIAKKQPVGPGLSDPGPILQMTQGGSMPPAGAGPSFGNTTFAGQLASLPAGMLDQLKALQAQPESMPTTGPAPSPFHETLQRLIGKGGQTPMQPTPMQPVALGSQGVPTMQPQRRWGL